MSKKKVSVEDKIYTVNLYLDGKESQRQIADMFDVSLASVQDISYKTCKCWNNTKHVASC